MKIGCNNKHFALRTLTRFHYSINFFSFSLFQWSDQGSNQQYFVYVLAKQSVGSSNAFPLLSFDARRVFRSEIRTTLFVCRKIGYESMECGCVCECDVRQLSKCHVLFVKPLKWILFCIFLHTTTDHSCISCLLFRNTYELFNNYSNRMRHRSHIFIDLFRFLRIMSCKLCVALSRVFHKMCIVYVCVNERSRICRVFFFVTTVSGMCVCVCNVCENACAFLCTFLSHVERSMS